MTKIDTSREAIEKLLDGVTPGPWIYEEYENNIVAPSVRVVSNSGIVICDNEPYYPQAVTPESARFIAAARELVPALLADLEAAEVERDRLREERDEWKALVTDALRIKGGA